jgi:hypothetical protein
MVLDNQGVNLQILTSNSAGFSQALEFYNNNVPASQTGYDFELEVRERADKTSRLLIALSTEDDSITVAGNVVTLNIDAATLAGFAAGTYYYALNSILIENPTIIAQELYGEFVIKQGVIK